MNKHPREALGAFADGELPTAEASRLEAHLAVCTECTRELAIIRSMGGAMRELDSVPTGGSTWRAVKRRLAPSLGWGLLVGGGLLWLGLAVVAWFREAFTLEWLAGTAVAVGLFILLVRIGWEQYLEWKDSPYREIER